MKIELYKTNEDKSQTTILTCVLTGSEGIVFTGDQGLMNQLTKRGIPNPKSKGNRLYPTDGRSFFDSLQAAFQGPYIFASEVIES